MPCNQPWLLSVALDCCDISRTSVACMQNWPPDGAFRGRTSWVSDNQDVCLRLGHHKSPGLHVGPSNDRVRHHIRKNEHAGMPCIPGGYEQEIKQHVCFSRSPSSSAKCYYAFCLPLHLLPLISRSPSLTISVHVAASIAMFWRRHRRCCMHRFGMCYRFLFFSSEKRFVFCLFFFHPSFFFIFFF